MEWVHVGDQKWCFKRSDWAMWLGSNWCGWKLRLSKMLRLLKLLWAGVKPAMLQRMACSGMYLHEEGVPLHPHTPMCVVYNYIVCLIVLHSQKNCQKCSPEWKPVLTATNWAFIQDIWSIEHWDMIIYVCGLQIYCMSHTPNDHRTRAKHVQQNKSWHWQLQIESLYKIFGA